MVRVLLTYLKTCLAAFTCSSVGQEENCTRTEIEYQRSGLVPVTKYIRDPIIGWNRVTWSFGCSVVPFVSTLPFSKGVDTVLEFSIPNPERIVPMVRFLSKSATISPIGYK